MDNEGNKPTEIGHAVTPIFLEEWPGPWAAWARSYSYKNLWRVTSILGNDLEEAVAECALVYVECKLRYGNSVQSPAAFMSLYKICVTSRFNDLSVKDSKLRASLDELIPLMNIVRTKRDEGAPAGEVEALCDIATISDAEAVVKISYASDELKEVLGIFCSAPQEVMESLRAEAKSCCPKQFFKHVVLHLGLKQSRTQPLARELQGLLS